MAYKLADRPLEQNNKFRNRPKYIWDLLYDKDSIVNHLGEKVLFISKQCQDNRKKIKINPYLTPYTSKNFKWIKDLQVKKKPYKYLKKILVNFLII